MLRISGRATDLGSKGPLALEFKYRIDRAPTAKVSLGMRCTSPLCAMRDGAMLDVTRRFRTAQAGVWESAAIPLSCLTAAGADLGSVEEPFVLETAGVLGVTLAQVRVLTEAPGANAPGGHAPCPAASAAVP
jgi:beta-glucosidase